MVNITARQWALKPLLNVRTGPGAVTLPPPPAPRLTSISVRYPKTKNRKPDRKTDGINKLLKEYLPRLKYYNPAVRIDVDNPRNADAACMLQLQFEGPDPDALGAIAQKSEKTKSQIRGPRRRLETPPEPASTDDSKPTYTFKQLRPNANRDEVVLKAQPAADPHSPSTVNPPTPIYCRSVTLATNSRPHWEIWKWMRYRIGGSPIKMNEEDNALKEQIMQHEQQSSVDRERMAGVSARMKDEQAALAKAKKSAEAAAAGDS